jgi:hypothetical protein
VRSGATQQDIDVLIGRCRWSDGTQHHLSAFATFAAQGDGDVMAGTYGYGRCLHSVMQRPIPQGIVTGLIASQQDRAYGWTVGIIPLMVGEDHEAGGEEEPAMVADEHRFEGSLRFEHFEDRIGVPDGDGDRNAMRIAIDLGLVTGMAAGQDGGTGQDHDQQLAHDECHS